MRQRLEPFVQEWRHPIEKFGQLAVLRTARKLAHLSGLLTSVLKKTWSKPKVSVVQNELN